MEAEYSKEYGKVKPKVKDFLICSLSDHNEGMLSEERYLAYCNKIHAWMTQTESTFRPRSDYLRFYRKITENEREVLVNWLIIIQVEFNLLPETLFITVNIIDRYLGK